MHPVDLVLDLALASSLEARFRMAVMNTDEGVVGELLRHPATVLGLSDAGAHASQLCDAPFATYLLAHWVRDKRRARARGCGPHADVASGPSSSAFATVGVWCPVSPPTSPSSTPTASAARRSVASATSRPAPIA